MFHAATVTEITVGPADGPAQSASLGSMISEALKK